LVTAAAATTAIATLIALAVLAFTLLSLWLLWLGRFAAEEVFQPTEKAARRGRWFGCTGGNGIPRTISARFETTFATRLTRFAWLRGKAIVIARLKRLLFARFAGPTVATSVRTERRTLIALRASVFVVGAITPADGRTFRFSGRQNFDFGLF
jgi:hypothetical protein